MKRLLYVSIPFLMMGCGTSEDSVQVDNEQDSTVVMSDTTLTFKDSLVIDLPLPDSANPIIHGTPDQEKLDSIKNSKKDQKKNG
ncbi:MAG: hypothetical protein GQ574_25475 [Crocinitomix sp.]|nr:hypothetical protein [Crocinitomix sp.]